MSLASVLEEIQLSIEILQSSLITSASNHNTGSVVEGWNRSNNKGSLVNGILPSPSTSHSLVHKVAAFLEDEEEEDIKLQNSPPFLSSRNDDLLFEKKFRKELEALIFSPLVGASALQSEASFSPSTSSKNASVWTSHEGGTTTSCDNRTEDAPVRKNCRMSNQFVIQEKVVDEKDLMHARGVERAASIALRELRKKTI